jgi:hypothetical protein
MSSLYMLACVQSQTPKGRTPYFFWESGTARRLVHAGFALYEGTIFSIACRPLRDRLDTVFFQTIRIGLLIALMFF